MKTIKDVQEFWDKKPCNIARSSAKVGSLEWCRETENNKYYVENHILKFADFKKWKGKKVLEIGCGIGITACSFAQSGAEVTVIDLSGESLKLAKKRAEVFGLSNKVEFYQGNAEELTEIVPIRKYDLIWSFGVIHHSPHPNRIIRRIKKYMGPQSELRIMLYHKFSWKVFWILIKFGKGAFWKIDKLIAQYSEAQLGCPVTYAYSEWAARVLLRGLKIKNIQIEHIFPYKFPEYKDNIYRKVWYFRLLPKRVFNRLEREFGWHMCITATL